MPNIFKFCSAPQFTALLNQLTTVLKFCPLTAADTASTKQGTCSFKAVRTIALANRAFSMLSLPVMSMMSCAVFTTTSSSVAIPINLFPCTLTEGNMAVASIAMIKGP